MSSLSGLKESFTSASFCLDPHLPLSGSPFVTGISFALLLSFNPCTIPFLGMIISVNNSSHTLLSLIAFGQGLITPSMGVVLLGQKILEWFEERSLGMERIKPLTYIILGISGIYLLYGPYILTSGDTIVALVGTGVSFYWMCHSMSSSPSPSPSRRTLSVRKFLPVLLIWTLFTVIVLTISTFTPHNAVTHRVVEDMIHEASKVKAMRTFSSQASSHTVVVSINTSLSSALPVPSQPSFPSDPSLVDSNGAVMNAAAGAGSGADSNGIHGGVGKLHHLRRQLFGSITSTTHANRIPDTTKSGVTVDDQQSSHTNDLAAVDRDHLAYHHLDQDGLESPSIVDENEVVQLIHSDEGDSRSHAGVNLNPSLTQLDHTDNLILSQFDLDTIHQLAHSKSESFEHEDDAPDSDDVKCIDMSMVPPCSQCQLLLFIIRMSVGLLCVGILCGNQVLHLFITWTAFKPNTSQSIASGKNQQRLHHDHPTITC